MRRKLLGFSEVIDLSSDDEAEAVELQDIKPDIHYSSVEDDLVHVNVNKISTRPISSQKSEEVAKGCNINALKVDGLHGGLVSGISSGPPTPLCQQFWKAGDYEIQGGFQPFCQEGNNHLRVHPKFLHSNATSHKWVFGAIAELVDNAVDEIKKGATSAIVDKVSVPRGGPALLIQDDGGGMDPDSLRSCISFGFSDKKSDSSIGQYGNGFKTSTMRLGADVVVFSRCIRKRTSTQSVGLLSYTFLRETGADDIIVPMIDYEFDLSQGVSRRLIPHGEKHFSSNLFAILKWSPFATEADLLKQFDEVGQHGTRILVFNLWHNSDDVLELDFDFDELDILTSGTPEILRRPEKHNKQKLMEQHIASRLHYSLRAYLSILYLHVPPYFRIILRGEAVQSHSLVSDLRYIECIRYTPNVEGNKEDVITSIGFLEGAPKLSIHGFNVYHRNRLILPFWRVVNNTSSRGRGVSGVLEANFMKPTHDKQDFEKSTLYFKLEARLKEMTLEYWKYHCHLVGYPNSVIQPPDSAHNQIGERQVVTALDGSYYVPKPKTEINISQTGIQEKRQREDPTNLNASLKRQSLGFEIPIVKESNCASVPGSISKCQITDRHCIPSVFPQPMNIQGIGQKGQDIIIMMQENKSLRLECEECEKTEKELLAKEQRLKNELAEAQLLLKKLTLESNSLGLLKIEK